MSGMALVFHGVCCEVGREIIIFPVLQLPLVQNALKDIENGLCWVVTLIV